MRCTRKLRKQTKTSINSNGLEATLGVGEWREKGDDITYQEMLDGAICSETEINFDDSLDACRDEKWIILPYMNAGSAQKFLRQEKTRKDLGNFGLFKIVLDTVVAIKYLHKRGIIHRDIAARNVLIELTSASNEVEVSVKNIRVVLGDFGLSKNLNSTSRGIRKTWMRHFPLIWTGPSSFRTGDFYRESDIWAIGVLMYEVFSWGADPLRDCHCGNPDSCGYQRLEYTEIQREIYHNNRYLIDMPHPCKAAFSPMLKKLMRDCWEWYELRPSAKRVCKELKTDQMKTVIPPPLSPIFPMERQESVSGATAVKISDIVHPAYPREDPNDPEGPISPSTMIHLWVTNIDDTKVSMKIFA